MLRTNVSECAHRASHAQCRANRKRSPPDHSRFATPLASRCQSYRVKISWHCQILRWHERTSAPDDPLSGNTYPAGSNEAGDGHARCPLKSTCLHHRPGACGPLLPRPWAIRCNRTETHPLALGTSRAGSVFSVAAGLSCTTVLLNVPIKGSAGPIQQIASTLQFLTQRSNLLR